LPTVRLPTALQFVQPHLGISQAPACVWPLRSLGGPHGRMDFDTLIVKDMLAKLAWQAGAADRQFSRIRCSMGEVLGISEMQSGKPMATPTANLPRSKEAMAGRAIPTADVRRRAMGGRVETESGTHRHICQELHRELDT